MNRLNVKNGKKNAIINLIVYLILAVNSTLVALGYQPLPFDEEAIYQGISALALAVYGLWVWWKNNNITDEAVQAQSELEKLKGMKKK